MELRAWAASPGRVAGVVRPPPIEPGSSERIALLVGDDTNDPARTDPSVDGWIAEVPRPPKPAPFGTAPGVGTPDGELLVPGDAVRLDGTVGTLSLPDVTERPVVTVFLERADGRVLLLQRAATMPTFPGRWAGVSGRIEQESPRDAAFRELFEETGIGPYDARLVAEGAPVLARSGRSGYRVHPFRIRASAPRVRPNSEHVGTRWIDPSELPMYATVPRLLAAWRSVAPSRGGTPISASSPRAPEGW